MTAAETRVSTPGFVEWCQCSPPWVNPRPILNILVAVDFSDQTAAVLNYAVAMAEIHGATLTLVHVSRALSKAGDLSSEFSREQLEQRSLRKMAALRRSVKEGIPHSVVVTTGTVWDRIIGMAKSWNADLIILGMRCPRRKYTLAGCTAEQVICHADCPVLVYQDHQP